MELLLTMQKEQVRQGKVLDDLYNKMYKNGLSADVKDLKNWKRNVNKILLSVLGAAILGFGVLIISHLTT